MEHRQRVVIAILLCSLLMAGLLSACQRRGARPAGPPTGSINLRVLWPQDTQPVALSDTPSVRQVCPFRESRPFIC